jgi:DNA-binding transcriptional MocR family regulator
MSRSRGKSPKRFAKVSSAAGRAYRPREQWPTCLGFLRNTVLIAYETLAAEDLIRSERGSGAHVNNWAQVALPRMAILPHEAQYPERITLLADPDGNPLYIRQGVR